MDALRFITCGSVDDGKSTLIGRLLYDTKLIFEDQLEALRGDSRKFGTQGEPENFPITSADRLHRAEGGQGSMQPAGEAVVPGKAAECNQRFRQGVGWLLLHTSCSLRIAQQVPDPDISYLLAVFHRFRQTAQCDFDYFFVQSMLS